MQITAALVKELRDETGVGMMECKKALTENGGDMEKAKLWLRERGMSRAAAKAGRATTEGTIEVLVNDEATAGVLVEVNCETDFVGKNEDFIKFAKDVAALVLKNKTGDIDAVKALKMDSGETVAEKLVALFTKIGENLNLRRVRYFSAAKGTVVGYTHMGGKIGTMVVIEPGTGDAVKELGKDLAMHVAAAAPKYLTSKEVDPTELEQEKELARKKLIEQKKPAEMIEKILIGQMTKFYKEVCFVDQPFIKDPDMTVGKLVESKAKGSSITAFDRFFLGEGIEKKKENFAEEVAAATKK